MGTYLSRTPGSEGNRKTWTFSTWFKRGTLASGAIFTAGSNGQDETTIRLQSSGGVDAIDWQLYSVSSSATIGRLITSQQIRDPSAWYHLVCRYDSTNGTAGDRMRMYLNGSEVTSFSTDTNPSQNYDAMINNTVLHNIGRASWNSSDYFSGYLAETILADGQSYAPTSFGQTDSTTGIWKPKTFSGSYGTNGFKLEYKNAGALGTDTSGQSNNFTATNFATSNQVVDTPSNNFATMNPIDVGANLSQTTFSEGNLKLVSSGTTTDTGDQVVSSMGFTKGKWYWEIKGVSNPDNMFWTVFTDVLGGERPYHNNYAYSFYGDGNGSNSQIYESQEGAQKGYGIDSSTCFSDNDIIQVAFDCDNYRLYIGKNGLWTDDNAAGSGTITTGSAFNQSSPTGYYQISTAAAQAGFYRVAIVKAGSSVTYTAQVNFGNPPFTIASGNADGAGYGNFEYAVPSGYYALCTENLNTYG